MGLIQNHNIDIWFEKKKPTFKMSNMVGLLFGPQCVIQSQNIPYEQNSYYRDFCELPQLQIAYLYIWTKYIYKKTRQIWGIW